MTDIKKLFGSNVKNYRNTLGISQARLAEMADTATNYLGLIELGKKFPSSDMIERIALALGKDTADLFALKPLQEDWRERILTDMGELINKRLEELKENDGEAARCRT